ncbi:MAG: nicotinamide-nucleotide adenylyltransferase [Candidatus Bathyarchaeota archaeon]|nr:MAG: nicotinamide-nucleotide adenylyltransferase [Candidatus Bathyarchaeota archaeon]
MNKRVEEWRRTVKGLFVGRFQPFHLGHLKAIEWILKRCEKVTIVIGSSLESFTQRNPFTFEERKEMIAKSLEKEGITKEKYEIIWIPDAFNCERWVKSILGKAEFDVVFTRSFWVKHCFDLSEIAVKEHPTFEPYSARKIRRMMKEEEGWESLLPSGSNEAIRQIDIKKRLNGRTEGKAENRS